MELLSDILKALLLCVFKTVIILIAVFSIILMLPREIFNTDKVEDGVRIAACVILIVGIIMQLTKCFIAWKNQISIFDQDDRELSHVFRAALFLSGAASLPCLVIFFWNLSDSKKVPTSDHFYFGLLSLFLLTQLIPPYTLITDDKERPKILSFVCDHYLSCVYVGIYIQINFLEAKETLELYHEPNSTHANTVHYHLDEKSDDHPIEDWVAFLHETFSSAAYAITVEVMALFLICYLEQKKHIRKQRKEQDQKLNHGDKERETEIAANPDVYLMPVSDKEGESTDPERPTVSMDTVDKTDNEKLGLSAIEDSNEIDQAPENAGTGEDGNNHDDEHATVSDNNVELQVDKTEEEKLGQIEKQNLEKCMKKVTLWDHLCFFVGLITIAPIVALITMHIVDKTGKLSAQSKNIITCKTTSFVATTIYLTILFCVTKAWLVSKRDREKVSNTLDIKLLRGSTYGMLLILLLVFSGTMCASKIPVSQSPLNYVNFIFNAIQVWLQYSFLYHCVALKKCLRLIEVEEWKRKLRLHVIPLGLANLFFWLYNLYQWKTVAMLALLEHQSPGPVWAVTEAILFPIAIFFRFHSAFLCFTLCTFQKPPWLRFCHLCRDRRQHEQMATPQETERMMS